LGKVRYEIDPHNKLVLQGPSKNADLKRFRRVLDGRYKIGPGNLLIYHVKSPMQGTLSDFRTPHQLKLKGTWSLTKNHDLRLTLNNWRRQTLGDELTLKGEILGAESNSLLFAVTTRSKDTTSTNILKVQGRWQADKNNRLTFRAVNENGKSDVLRLSGLWEINKQHKIIYRYEKSYPGKIKKLKKSLGFKGFWDITKHSRLTYKLDLKGESQFDFRTGIATLSNKYIKYEIGIGLSDKYRPIKRIIILYGKWKIKKRGNILFEIEYENQKPHAIKFGIDTRLTEKDKIEFKLRNKFGQPLGMEVTLSRKILKGSGTAYLKLLKSAKENAAHVGIARQW